jgi:GMP synthase (glutamine-hydrolysing)
MHFSMRVVVLVTGQPVPDVLARRGDFTRLLREASRASRLRHPCVAGLDAPEPRRLDRWSARDLRTDAPAPGPRDADAFVITGSAASVTERAPWMLRAERLVRAIAEARVPLLGVCFGHQMIAQALGGRVERNPRGREIGTVRLTRVADDPIFVGLPRSFDVNATHVDSVTRLPPGARLLATTALDTASAFAIGDAVRAVQFHPEFDAEVMRGYLRARARAIADEGGDPAALLARVHGGTRGRDVLPNFLGLARAGAARGHSTCPVRRYFVFDGPTASA